MKNLIRLVCVLLLLLHLPTLRSQIFAGQENKREQPIELSQQVQLIEREIGGNQSHYYYINLQENQFLFLDVVQLGVDIKVIFQGEDASFEINTPEIIFEPEPLYWIAKKTGKYMVIIKPFQENAKLGKYSIRVGELRTTNTQDICYINGQEQFIEAEKLRSKNNRDAFLSAIDSYKKSNENWEKVQQTERQAVCLNLIGETSFNLEDLESAKVFIERAKDLFPMGSGLAQAFGNLGFVYYSQGDIEKAVKSFSKALEMSRSINDRNVRVNALNGLGDLYYSQLNRKDEAFSAYNEVITVSREINNLLEEGAALYHVATIFRDLTQYEKALSLLNEALVVSNKAGSPLGNKLTILSEIALNQVYLRKFDLAAKTYDIVIDLATKNNLTNAKVRTLISKGYSQLLQGEYGKSLITNQEALNLNREGSKNPAFEGVILRNTGLGYFLLGDSEKALTTYEKAYEIAEKLNLDQHRRWLFYRMAEVYKSLGKLDLALQSIEKVVELTEKIREKSLNTEVKTFQLVEGNDFYDFYVDLLMNLHEKEPSKSYDKKAFYIYELSKARTFLDLVNESGINIRQGVNKELIDKELELQLLITQKSSSLRNATSEEEKNNLTKELNLLDLNLKQIQADIKGSSGSYSQIGKISPLSVEELQKQILDDNTLLIEYSLGKSNSYVWAVSNTNINSYKLPSRAEIEKLSRPVGTYLKTRFKIENESEADKKERLPQEQFLVKSLASFSDIVLGQISKHLSKKKLVFVANGTLQGIPFAALLKPGANSNGELQPLIMEHEIVVLPSSSTLAALKEKNTQGNLSTKSILIVADPVLTSTDNRLVSNSKTLIENAKLRSVEGQIGVALAERVFERGSFGRLAFASREAEEIANVYSKDNPKVLLGLDANLPNVTNPEVGEYGILHFITHGFIDQVKPELSGIVLSLYDENGKEREGYLTANNVFNLKLKTDLVVLSACETGLGKEIKAEGILGLSRGFFYAGAKRVMFTLWNINDESTAILMSRFYTAMKKDKLNPAAALRQAQLSMYKDKKWAAPYYWAAFQIQGDF